MNVPVNRNGLGSFQKYFTILKARAFRIYLPVIGQKLKFTLLIHEKELVYKK